MICQVRLVVLEVRKTQVDSQGCAAGIHESLKATGCYLRIASNVVPGLEHRAVSGKLIAS